MVARSISKLNPLARLESENNEETSAGNSTTFPKNLQTFGHFIVFNIMKREKGTITAALRGEEYLKTILHSIFLPMPANLSTGYSADYQNEELDQIGRFATGLAGGIASPQSLSEEQRNKQELMKSLGELETGTTQTAKQTDTPTLTGAENALKSLGGTTMATLQGALEGINRTAIKAIAAEVGVAKNPHRIVLFSGVNFREHQFQYRLSPKNREESYAIRDLIYNFKKYMLPNFGRTGYRTYMDYPEIFEIAFRNREFLFEIQPSVLKSFTVNYHPLGYPAYIRDDTTIAPVEVDINMTFQEIELFTRDTAESEFEFMNTYPSA